MKIAFLNIYGGRYSRGAEIAVHEVAKHLSKNHQVSVFQSGKSPNVSYTQYYVTGIPIIATETRYNFILRLLKKFYLDPYSLLVLFFSLKCLPKLLRNKYDVLISINGFWQIIICKLVRLLISSKVIVLGYAGIGIDDYINLKLNPDAFFAMTYVAKSWAKKINPNIPIQVLPGGVNTQIFHSKVQPIKLSLKPPIILTVAALSPYKRVDLVIRAVARLKNASLVVAGNGILKDEIESLGTNLLAERFRRLDIDYKYLPALYTACQVFTLPSSHKDSSLFSRLTGVYPSEAFGIVYLEAMSSGLPVVAPDDPLRREIIGKAGILVNCEDINAYSLSLTQALQRKWENIPRDQAKKFDWEKIVFSFSNDLIQICG